MSVSPHVDVPFVRRIALECYGADASVEVVRRYNFDAIRLMLPDGPRIVKVAPGGDPSTIAREVAIVELLARHGVPAPIVEHHDASGARFGRAFVALDVRSETSVMERLGHPTDAPRLVAQMGALLARVHSIALPPPGAAGALPLGRREASDARASLDGVARRLLTAGVLDAADVRQLDGVAMPDPSGSALAHGDFHAGRCMGASDTIVSVVGWEHAWLGAPAVDVAIAEAYFEYYGLVDLRRSFVEGYVSVRSLGRDHERETRAVRVAHVLDMAEYFHTFGWQRELDRAIAVYREACGAPRTTVTTTGASPSPPPGRPRSGGAARH